MVASHNISLHMTLQLSNNVVSFVFDTRVDHFLYQTHFERTTQNLAGAQCKKAKGYPYAALYPRHIDCSCI